MTFSNSTNSSNSSTFDEGFYNVNSAINIGLVIVLTLPELLVCGLSLLAIVFAKEVNTKLRALLINILATDMAYSIGITASFLQYPIKARNASSGDISCSTILSILLTSDVNKLVVVAVYAIMVYLFIKYNVKKLKWYTIVPSILIPWVLAVGLSQLTYSREFGVSIEGGFCTIDPTPLYIAVLITVWVVEVIGCLPIIVIFSVLTYLYIRNNVLEGNSEIKKAITRNLFYHLAAAVFSLLHLIPTVFPLVFANAEVNVTAMLVMYYILNFVFRLPSLFTPVVTIIMLDPLRKAVKKLLCCGFCKKNQVHPL